MENFMEDELLDDLEEELPSKMPRMSGSELYKPPTLEEMSSLRETEALFHSNLIRMQINELLKEVSLSEKKRTKIDEYLHTLYDVIMSLPITDEIKLSHLGNIFKDIKIPFVMKPLKVKGNMTCFPPSDIKVVGSYLLHTNLKQGMKIDLSLQMPKDCLQAKDHLNQRYLRKRAIYLTYVANYLKNHELVSDLQFSYFQENPLKPILLLEPSGKLSEIVTICIHISPPDEHFKVDRFMPAKSNVRVKWFTGISQADDPDPLLPTPSYNSLILEDILMPEHLKYLFEVIADCEGIRDGIKLLKIWLRQRQLDQGFSCFSGFIMTMLVVHLMKKKKVNKFMSSYQVVRNTFQYLGISDWSKDGIGLCDNDVSSFHSHFEVVFVDSSGCLNLCANVSRVVYKQVCIEALLSLQTLDNKSINDSFDSVFMVPVPFFKKFDQFFHISNPALLENVSEKMNLLEKVPEHGGNCIAVTIPHIAAILQRGLGSRVKSLGFKGQQYGTWDVTYHPPLWKKPTSVASFGLLLNTNSSFSALDKGPGADTPEAVEFRKFWGDISDLRRFQDGSICEAVLWSCRSQKEKRKIPEKICKHLLKLHCGLPPGSISYISNQIEDVFTLATDGKQKHYVPLPGYIGTGDEINLSLIHSYNELCRQLRNLKDLPLTVVSLQGISPALRYTEVFPPTRLIIDESHLMKTIHKNVQVPESDQSAPPYVRACEVICNLEGSGKWPQDVSALRRLKAAFHLTLAKELQFQNDVVCRATQNYIDVFKDGFVFRVIVAYHREVTIMRTLTTKDGMIKIRNTPQSMDLEQRTVRLPRLSSALHGIHQKQNAFGLTCRLAKSWINGQLLSHHIPEIAVELLCASAFVSPRPFTEPCSSQAGFLRFLTLLSTFDFQENPLIVDLKNEINESDLTKINKNFHDNRDSLPALFIVTSWDKTRSLWTRNYPIRMILHRMKCLATQALSSLEKMMMVQYRELDFKEIFTGHLSAYDILIHLKSECVSRRFETYRTNGEDVNNDDMVPSSDENQIIPVVNFDPVQHYLDELEASYGEVAMFFYNVNGGNVIGVIWKPNAFKPTEFKISRVSCLTEYKGTNETTINVNSMVEDFQILGRNLVSNIELRSDKWMINQ